MERTPAVFIVALLFAFAPAAPAHPGSCAVESDDAGRTIDFEIDADIEFDGDDIVFERDDRVIARIVDRKVLEIGGEPVALDAEARETVADYADTYHELVDDAKEIGMAGARLGVSAAIRAVTSVFTGGDADEVEREIEAEAAEIEEMAIALCDTIAVLREHHETLSAQVPAFGAAVPIQD